MYHEQQASCPQCPKSFRVILECPEFPPRAEQVYECVCPYCRQKTQLTPTAGTQRERVPEGFVVARPIMA
jgi:hypothetical protein